MNNFKRLARVKLQDLDDVKGRSGAYEHWVGEHMPTNEWGDALEPVESNPDSLVEGTSYFEDVQPTRAQMLMGEAIKHLQGQQKAIYMLTMRESLSLSEAAKKLGIAKSTAQVYRERAIKFIQQYCERHTTW